MKNIQVEIEQLEQCAARMDERNQDYQRNYQELFSTVDMMRNAWQGDDNIAFSNKIDSYRSNFEQLALLCSQYIEYIRASARSYRATQEELVAQASNL